MEALTHRQNYILQQAAELGKVDVEPLAEAFAVSTQTIRKDLNDLSARGLLQRVRGGAIVGSANENFSYESRSLMEIGAKQAIGRAVAQIIPNNTSLLLNLGTTVEQVACALLEHSGLFIITNNINVVNIMREYHGIQVVIAGGEVRKSDGGIIGVAAKEFIEQFKTDYAVIGTSAIDEDGEILDYDFKEVAVAQTIIKNARKVILAADVTKLERRASVCIASLAEIDIVVTNQDFPANLVEFCASVGTKIIVAQEK